MDLSIVKDGKTGGSLQASDAVFGAEFNEPLVHQVVVAFQAGARQGTKAQPITDRPTGVLLFLTHATILARIESPCPV